MFKQGLNEFFPDSSLEGGETSGANCIYMITGTLLRYPLDRVVLLKVINFG